MSYNGAAKFNPSPGKVYMEKQIILDGVDCYPWRETFIWWPWVTTITGQRIFWKKIYKRRVQVVWGAGFHMTLEVQYAANLFEVLTHGT
jgi:hypothetical protein